MEITKVIRDSRKSGKGKREVARGGRRSKSGIGEEWVIKAKATH